MKNSLRILTVIWFLGLVTGAMPLSAVDLEVTDLRCEYLMNPLGIDTLEPRLSWVIESSRRGQMQRAYRILVASSEEKLRKDVGDLWDTGRMESDQSVHVVYRGKTLLSRTLCHWKVKAWGASGAQSEWSEPARWSMGLLSPLDWKADWIGTEEPRSFPTTVVGFLARPASKADEIKWVQIDLGRSQSIDSVKLYPLFSYDYQWKSSTPGYGFPVRFRIDVSDDATFKTYATIADHTREDYPNPGRSACSFEAGSIKGRFVRLTALNLWDRKVTERPYMFALAEMEVFSGGKNIAVNKAVAAKDSIQGWGLKREHLTDGITLADVEIPPDHEDLNHSRLPARYLRCEFHVGQKVKRATAYVCGLGFFDFHINGKHVSDQIRNPALTSYRIRSLYVTFDVTDKLIQGDNAVGIVLGNGRYFGPRYQAPGNPQIYGYPKLLFRMEIENEDGSLTDILSDSRWKLTTEGPVRANNEFDGEEYDARREMPGWSRAGFDDSGWEFASRVSEPGPHLQAQMMEPMRFIKVIKPVVINEPKPGYYLVDMGQVFYGTVRLKVQGPTGTEVRLRCSYHINPDNTLRISDNRTALITDIYTLKGSGTETWNPRFRGQGYRFVEVVGFPGKPTVDNFEGLVIHTDFEEVGHFKCSNELINRIHANILWGQRSYYRSVPMEPDRDERQGWMGNQARDFESTCYNFYSPSLMTKWLRDIRFDQLSDGHVPNISPTFWASYGANIVWPSNVIMLPELVYDFYGDRRVLEENYEAMKKWMVFISRHFKSDYTVDRNTYGDWCDAYSMDGNPNRGKTSGPLISTSYLYHNSRIMERVARLLGRPEDEFRFADLAARIKKGFNERFFNPEDNTYANKTQTTYALPLSFGLVDPDFHPQVVTNLVNDILVKHNGHLSVGLIGIIWLMQVLTDEGHPEVAYTIVTQTTRPSWGYMISKGATTIWERWDGDTRDPKMNSEALLILTGRLVAWFYQSLAGIDCDPERPGFKHIRMRPQPVGDLRFADASHRSMYGEIKSSWKIEKDRFIWEVTIPANTTATLYMPADCAAEVTEQGLPAGDAEGVKYIRMEQDRAVFIVGSGSYSFVSNWRR